MTFHNTITSSAARPNLVRRWMTARFAWPVPATLAIGAILLFIRPELPTAAAAAPAPGSGSSVATVELNYAGGKPNLVACAPGNLDSGPPLAKSATHVFRLGPGDKVVLDVEGTRKFTGRTLAYSAELVKITRHTERKWIFFSETVEERNPTVQPQRRPVSVQIGTEVQVELVAKDLAGKEFFRHAVTATAGVDLRLDRPADVFVELQCNDDDVAWNDRSPTEQDLRDMADQVEELRNQTGSDEARVLDDPKPTVLKGDLDQLRLKLTASRP